MLQPILSHKAVKQPIWYWTHAQNLRRFRHIVPPLQEVVTSDASMEGWEAHFQDQAVQDRWPFQSQSIISNILELRAAFQALLAFSLREKLQSGSHNCKLDRRTFKRTFVDHCWWKTSVFGILRRRFEGSSTFSCMPSLVCMTLPPCTYLGDCV